MPFKMKNSLAKIWPWSKTKKTIKQVTDKSGQTYRVVDKTRKRGKVTVKKHSTKSFVNPDINPDLWVKIYWISTTFVIHFSCSVHFIRHITYLYL